jgi:hypothetical protein
LYLSFNFTLMLKSILPFMIFLLPAFAEGQTGTIKVKKNDCNCLPNDTVAVPDTDLPASGQGGDLTVKGTVMDTISGKPLGKVVIYYSVDGKKSRTMTDAKGTFFIQVPPGSFRLSARIDCYEIKRSEFGPDSSTLFGCDIWMMPCRNVTPVPENKTPDKGRQ